MRPLFALSLLSLLPAVPLFAQAPPPPPPFWEFRGAKEDFARMAQAKMGIVRHIGKRLPTGFVREFDDISNAAVEYLAFRDAAALERYSAALGHLADTRWGVDRVGGYDYNCDGATVTELMISYELLREHVTPEAQRRIENWLYEWARIRADESILKHADWKWEQRLNQQNYGGSLAAVARILETSRTGKFDTAPLRRWLGSQHEFHTVWSRDRVMLQNALGWDVKSRPADEAVTQYSNWDALNLWEISRAKGLDAAKLEKARRYFEYFLLLTAPNGARARFGHDYQRDSVAAVFAIGSKLFGDGRYKHALNRVVDFSIEKRYRFPMLDLIWSTADDSLRPVTPRKKHAYITTPWTDYLFVDRAEMPDKIVFRDGWNASDDAFLFLDLRHTGQHALADSHMLGSYIWRGVPWLTNTSERSLHTADIDYRWQANTLLIRPGAGKSAPEYLRHRESDKTSADPKLQDVNFQEFATAAFASSSVDAAGFRQTRAVWHLDGAYSIVFDSAKALQGGMYTVGTAWHTAQQPRFRNDRVLLLEDKLENQFSLRWFPGQPVQTEALTRRYIGTPEASTYYGQRADVLDVLQASAREYRQGEEWTNMALLLPHRKQAYKAEQIGNRGIRVEQPGSIEIAAVNPARELKRLGGVAVNGSAFVARWSRKFAAPVRVMYIDADHIQLDSALAPDRIVLRQFRQQPWYADSPVDASESVLPRTAWKYAAGLIDVRVPSGSGEIEVVFAEPARTVLSFNRDWKQLSWDAPGASEGSYHDAEWKTVQLPYSEPSRGDGPNVHWYRKQFTVPASAAGKRASLEFEGVAIHTKLWVNGREAGEHLGAFNSFRFDITPLLNPPGQPNVVAVRADYAPSWRYKIPFLPEGYNDWGGIYRDVWLSYADPVHVNSAVVTTPGLTAEKGVVRVVASLMNAAAEGRSGQLVTVVYDPDQHEVTRAATPIEVPAGATRSFTQETPALVRPRLWSPAAPNLYTVVSRVEMGGRVVDEVKNPLGFRWFRFDPDKGFFLNGEHLKLQGANMHQGYPYLGNAVPNSKMPFDLHVLKQMGCNFLRTTHITMDPVVLEMADRLGLLVWEEIPVAGFGNGRMGEPLYDESAKQQMREMIRRDRNHPSIILWATMNEAAGGESKQRLPATRKLCKELHDIAKQEDPTRLTSIAETVEAFFGITDVSGRNGYFRGANLYQLGPTLDKLKSEHPETPMLISEYGAPNVERGSFGLGRTDTEEYAAVVHEHNNRMYATRRWIAGSTIWDAFDYFHGAPHEGVTDEARYPKDVYYYFQSQWSSEPVLRIRSAAHWNFGTGSPDRRNVSAHDVIVDSNCDTVELFLNGRSQGTQTGPGPFVWKQLAYSPGELKAVGRKRDAVLEHWRVTASAPYRVELNADTNRVAADGRDVAYLKVRLVDADGRLVANSYEPVQVSVSGPGMLASPATQKLLAGVATLASVRSTGSEGEIRVAARVGRLKSGEVVIRSTAALNSVEYE